jgi:hypothetical protein
MMAKGFQFHVRFSRLHGEAPAEALAWTPKALQVTSVVDGSSPPSSLAKFRDQPYLDFMIAFRRQRRVEWQTKSLADCLKAYSSVRMSDCSHIGLSSGARSGSGQEH